MATLQDIRRRIASTENTRKITKAMELVSAAKLRRAQARMESLRPYAGAMVEMMRDLATFATEKNSFALLREHDSAKAEALLVITGDRGLAGAFNANVLRACFAADRELAGKGLDRRLLVVGKKGIGTLRFRGLTIDQSWSGKSDRPTYADAEAIAHHVIDLYTSEQVDRVRLIYNHFKTPIEQTLMDVQILPIQPQEIYTEGSRAAAWSRTSTSPRRPRSSPRCCRATSRSPIFRALLESSASEQGARMTAMRNASESADELIDRLTLSMNRARQASITQEILEVVAGAEALG